MKKVLIVDDVLSWQVYHKKILEGLLTNASFYLASSAKEGYDLVVENISEPFDIVITDLQMESDFEPKYAGEWLVEQIKTLKAYVNTKIVISSAAYNIRQIAEFLGVESIPKRTALNFSDVYDFLK